MCKENREGTLRGLHVLSGIAITAAKNDLRSGVGVPLTWVMKLVGARPYWYAGDPLVLADTYTPEKVLEMACFTEK
jgi:hypothetical protein